MTALPTEAGAVFIGSVLRDPGEGPWGGGAFHHGPPLPPGPCSNCGGSGWINDEFYGGSLGVRCPACREAS